MNIIIFPFFRILHKYLNQIFLFAVHGDSRRFLVHLVRSALRLHSYSHMKYLYMAGRFREAYNIFASRTPRKQQFAKIWRRSREITEVLENGYFPVRPKAQQNIRRYNRHVLLTFHYASSYTSNGYTVRSKSILRALREKGVMVSACTRLGYPWDLAEYRHHPIVPFSKIGEFKIYHFHDPERLIQDADSLYVNAYTDKLSVLAENENVSIIHASSNYLNGIAAGLAARKLGVKSVYEMRGLWHLSQTVTKERFDEQSEYFRYCDIMEVAAAMLCDGVVVISNPLKEWLVSKGVPNEKIYVVPNAAEINIIKTKLPRSIPELKHLSTKYVIGFIGSLTRYEGVDLIIRAVAALLPEYPDIHCLIVGDGSERLHLEELTAKLGINEVITFVGQVPRSQVEGYYRLIDVFPLPRKPYPVCHLVPPLKPFEIMAQGKPIIVSDLQPLTDIVKHQETGIVCKIDSVSSLVEAIKLLYSDPTFAAKLAESGRQWVIMNRTWKHNGVLYEHLYTQI